MLRGRRDSGQLVSESQCVPGACCLSGDAPNTSRLLENVIVTIHKGKRFYVLMNAAPGLRTVPGTRESLHKWLWNR